MRYLVTAVMLSLFLAIGSAALADTIILTNGDKIEGEILEEGSQGVKVQTKYGPITLSRRSIRKIIKEGPTEAEYKEKAAELAQDHAELGDWCKEQGLEEEAKKHYEMALKFNPDNADARKALGFVKKGDKWVKGEEKAEKEPKKEAKKEPEKKEPEKKEPAEKLTREQWQRLHQEALQKLQGKEYEDAEKILKRIVKAVPNDSTALYNLACLYSLTSKKEKALDYLEKSIKAGFTNAGHIQKDSDLDNIRNEEKYKELIKKLIESDKGNM
jgi:tetratricopeptide (TPR) repeat protein